MTKLKIHRVHPEIVLPKFQTQQSACFDLSYQPHGKYHVEGLNSYNAPVQRPLYDKTGIVAIAAGDRLMIPTGLILDIPEGYSVRIHPRSGLAYKHGLVLANCEGVIDSDYVEEIFILLHNTSEITYTLHVDDRIAQAELIRAEEYTIEDLLERPTQKTDRVGGMGSTGINKVYSPEVENLPEEKIEETVKRGRGRPKIAKTA